MGKAGRPDQHHEHQLAPCEQRRPASVGVLWAKPAARTSIMSISSPCEQRRPASVGVLWAKPAARTSIMSMSWRLVSNAGQHQWRPDQHHEHQLAPCEQRRPASVGVLWAKPAARTIIMSISWRLVSNAGQHQWACYGQSQPPGPAS